MVQMASLGMGVPTYGYAANTPIKLTDPTGLTTFGVGGQVCTTQSCAKKPGTDDRQCKHKPEEGNGLSFLPPPGECADTDGIYSPQGILKIYDGVTCDALCGPDNGYVYFICNGPTKFFPNTRPGDNWPQNPYSSSSN